MTDQFKQPNDDFFYEALLEQGKSPDCTCRMDWHYRQKDGKRTPILLYTLKCPVHYPKTSKLFNQENERRKQEDL